MGSPKKSRQQQGLTDAQLRIVAEIRRIATKLDSKTLSQSQFDEHHEIGGVTTAGSQFGSWNEAVEAAGLEPLPSAASNTKPKFSDDELLKEIIAVHTKLGVEPSERKMEAHSRFSIKPFRARWTTFAAAKAAAYERFGVPE